MLLGFVVSYLTLTYLSHKLAALATLVAIGIGLHNFGEGLAIGTSFAFGELALGTFLIIGFMIHNVTEGLGIATAATEERRVSIARLVLLVLIAGAPAILGTWLGGYVRSDVLGVRLLRSRRRRCVRGRGRGRALAAHARAGRVDERLGAGRLSRRRLDHVRDRRARRLSPTAPAASANAATKLGIETPIASSPPVGGRTDSTASTHQPGPVGWSHW